MIKLLAFLFFFGFAYSVYAQNSVNTASSENAIRLIVRGDDMGFCHAANDALIECYQKGMMKSIELMPVTPWFPEAVKLLKENPSLDVGIHLALSSEWENLKWRPLTHCPSLTEENGYLYPMTFKNPDYKGRSLSEQRWKIEEIEQELRAQIELAVKEVPWISHLSPHMAFSYVDPKIAELLKKLAIEYNLDIDLEELGVQRVSYDGSHKTTEEKIASFTKMLEGLNPGTYMFLDHPAYDVPEVQAVYHIGYEDVATDRQGVTDLFTSDAIMEIIKKKGIELISYADLVKKDKGNGK